MKRTTLALAPLLALAACGGPASTPAESPTPTPTSGASYSEVVELKDAAVAAGLPCPDWRQENQITEAATSGYCSGSSVLSVYLDSESKQRLIRTMKTLPIDGDLLVGGNWIISANSDELDVIQPAMGGQRVVWTMEATAEATGATVEPSTADAAIPGDGLLEVGADVKPGKYKSSGAASGNCYWARLSSSQTSDITDNGNSAGPVTVVIKPSDKYFQTSGCDAWSKA